MESRPASKAGSFIVAVIIAIVTFMMERSFSLMHVNFMLGAILWAICAVCGMWATLILGWWLTPNPTENGKITLVVVIATIIACFWLIGFRV